MSKKCCFIGHREVENESEIEELLEKCLQRLIDEGVREFLFGSRSEFDTLCHRQVTKLKEKYPDIKRIAYTCKSEYACNPDEKEKTERWLEKVTKRKVEINAYEGKEQSERLQKAGKASYVERNEDLINASDYCVFYYNPNYLPPKRKGDYRPPSGTAIAYKYACQRRAGGKELKIINLWDENEKQRRI